MLIEETSRFIASAWITNWAARKPKSSTIENTNGITAP